MKQRRFNPVRSGVCLLRCNGHFFTDEEHEMLTPLATHQLCVIQRHGLSVTHNYCIVTCQLCSTEDCLLQPYNCSIQLLAFDIF